MKNDVNRSTLVRQRVLWKRIKQNKYIYLLILPGIVQLIVFCYFPMGGVLLAFKKYNASLGIWASPCIGMNNFNRIFITPAATKAIINTLEISFSRIALEFIPPIALALMLNEIPNGRLKKGLQTIYTFPHFLSWVVVAIVIKNFFAYSGGINEVRALLALDRVNFLADKQFFRPLLYLSDIWKESGWGTIIYLAAIAAVDPCLYEAAQMDGANRWQQTWHVTLPGMKGIIVINLILGVGGVMNAGFDQIFNLTNSSVTSVSQIIDTYVYDITFKATADYGFSTAVGLFKSVINMLLLLAANLIAKRTLGAGIFTK